VKCFKFLGKDEQLRVEKMGDVVVYNGPGMKCLMPCSYRSAETVKADTLGATEYVKIKDLLDGSERLERGPQLLFLDAYEEITEKAHGISLGSTDFITIEDKSTGHLRIQKGPGVWFPGPLETGTKGTAISLSNTEYIQVKDRLTGAEAMVKGPVVWFPQPYDVPTVVKKAIALREDEYIKVKDLSCGKRWVQKGKDLVFLEPAWEVEVRDAKDTGIRKAWVLKTNEYVRLIDGVTGSVRMFQGEQTVFPGPNEELLDGDKRIAEDVKVNEYVKILNQANGDIKVLAGPRQVMLQPHEKFLDGGKKKAVEIDGEHAAVVRDKRTGHVRLVTEHQLFVPDPYESIEEIRQLIKLADHEAVIVKDSDGAFGYYYGSDEKRALGQPRSFFLPPHAEIVKLCWSRGRRREKRDLYIERFDTRAQYMSFEFNCRTKDNVELILEGTFFWEVVDLPRMVQSTGDTSGDMCSHARSEFIKHVAQVTLKEFMDDINCISRRVYQDDQHFYQSRGVKVHSLEVTRYACAEESTSEVLQQIIQETTNRMNRLSQAESENEVKIFRMQGQIEQEKLSGELLNIRHEHLQNEAKVHGSTEADRIAAFIDGLAKDVPNLQDRINMWQTLRKTDALTAVSQGGATLYYTPNDVNLSIETKAPELKGP